MEKIAVVTGATRGLGWGVSQALARQGYQVLLLGRRPEALAERKHALESEGRKAEAFTVDLNDEASIREGAAGILRRFPRIHLLVNNAGVFLDREGYDPAKVRATLQANTLGPLQLSYALAPALLAGRANVVNVSSGMGSLSDMGAGSVGYRVSKAALNAVTRVLSQEWKEQGVRVNSVCPGWVRTDMGGAEAPRALDEGVASILWAATLPEDGPTGGFFRDGKRVDW